MEQIDQRGYGVLFTETEEPFGQYSMQCVVE